MNKKLIYGLLIISILLNIYLVFKNINTTQSVITVDDKLIQIPDSIKKDSVKNIEFKSGLKDIENKYNLISGKYIIGTDYYDKDMQLKYIGNRMFRFDINAPNCRLVGKFLVNSNNIGEFKSDKCGIIRFDLNKILSWIENNNKDARNYPIDVKVDKKYENCIVCGLGESRDQYSLEFDPWGEYWRVEN